MQFNFLRRLDDLGRIVIPKEIRNKLNFNNGDLLELSINNENLLIRKNNNLLDLNYIKEVINLIEYLSDVDILVTNNEKIIVKGKNLFDIKKEEISENLKNIILDRKTEELLSGIKISNDYFLDGHVYVKSLIKDSNMLGLLIVRSKNNINNLKDFINMLVKILL